MPLALVRPTADDPLFRAADQVPLGRHLGLVAATDEMPANRMCGLHFATSAVQSNPGGAARAAPYSWVAQTGPGGRIVTPVDMGCMGVLVALDVAADGTARGCVFDHAAFMLLRDQRGLLH